MHAVIPELERSNVETVLERFQTEQAEYPRRRNQLIAIRYYLRSMLTNCQNNWQNVTRGVTNYKALLDRIDHRTRGAKLLVNFNYDTLLESALASTVSVKINNLMDYISSDYKLVKPHGSIDWTHEVFPPMGSATLDSPHSVIERAAKIHINEEFAISPPSATTVWQQGRPAMIPALTIPVANKSDYECPREQQLILNELLPSVDKLLVIGWRATENRFLNTLSSRIGKNVRMMVISSSGEHASEIANRISARFRENQVYAQQISAGQGGFSWAIVSGAADDFLMS